MFVFRATTTKETHVLGVLSVVLGCDTGNTFGKYIYTLLRCVREGGILYFFRAF